MKIDIWEVNFAICIFFSTITFYYLFLPINFKGDKVTIFVLSLAVLLCINYILVLKRQNINNEVNKK
jgi:hypothetical protein